MSTIATGPMVDLAGGPAIRPEHIWRISVKHYHEMIQAGILTEADPIELLEGWLVYKMPKKPLHCLTTQMLRQILEKLIPPGWFVSDQDPITTGTSEPEPDISVIRGQRLDFKNRHPGPADVGLVVEVSETTLDRDQGWKKKIYAEAGIAVYWIVNLLERRIEVYMEPTRLGQEWDYQSPQLFDATAAVPFALNGQFLGTVTLAQILDGSDAALDNGPVKDNEHQS